MKNIINKWLFMAIATFITMIDMGAVFSFGAYFIVIMDRFQTDRSRTATVQSLLIGTTLCFGVVSGVLISKLGLPVVTFISSVLVTVGFCASFFATSVVFLYVSISIVSGIGISMAYISCVVVVGRLFEGKQRLMCISILTTSNAVASLLYPFLIDVMTERYGVHGTFLIQGGVCCNTIVFFTLCWVNRSKLTGSDVKDDNTSRKNSYHNENKNDSSETSDKPVPKEQKAILRFFKTVMSFKFMCLLLATGLSIGALNGYFSLVTDIAQWKGFNNSQGLMSIVLYQSFNVIGRLSPGIIKLKKGVSSFVCPIVAAALGCIGQIVLYVASGFVVYGIGTALSGMALGGILSSSLGLVVEMVQLEQVPVASGLVYTINGLLSAGFGYGLGVLRDRSGTYNGVLVIVGALLGTAAFLFTFDFISKCRKLSKEDNEEVIHDDRSEDQNISIVVVNNTKL